MKKGVKYLDEVISELPNGFINKTKTGVGATTIEANSTRCSIIVEPLKVTACEKARKTKDSIYVGTGYGGCKEITNVEILEYLSNPSIKNKKIFTVADSLERVISLISEERLKEFFLLIDESDSIQHDSNYRCRMNDVMRVYKNHSEEKRAMISATPVETHDPLLLNERKTNFNFEELDLPEIELIHTQNIPGNIVEMVEKITRNHPAEKMVIAYNAIAKNLILAEELQKRKFKKSDIAILCSEKSKKKVKDYEDLCFEGKLPRLINFKTSAYFNGFDIEEKYHLIIVSDSNDNLNRPSIDKIAQISGRGRNGLHSLTLLQKFEEEGTISKFTLTQLEKRANELIDTLKCMKKNWEKRDFSGFEFYKEQEREIKAVESYLNNNSIAGFNLVHVFKTKESYDFQVSYPSIDAILDNQQVMESTYSNEDDLEQSLKDAGYSVNTKHYSSVVNVDGTLSAKKLKELTTKLENDALEKISKLPKNVKDEIKNSSTPIESKIYEIYEEYSKDFDSKRIVEIIQSEIGVKKVLESLEKIELKLNYARRRLYDTIFSVTIERFFPIGEKIYLDELDDLMKAFLEATKLDEQFSKAYDSKTILSFFRLLKEERKGRKYVKIISAEPFSETEPLKLKPAFSTF